MIIKTKKMNLCKLCKEREANQTGSHIIPNFMLVPIIGKRYKEESIKISTNLSKKEEIYYGRDNLKNTDTEIKEHHFTEDYIFCTKCENFLNVELETPFSSFHKKLDTLLSDKNNFFISHTAKSLRYLECIKFDYQIFIRFFYSILWRMSISKKDFCSKIKLPNQIEESLRKTIISKHFEEFPIVIQTVDKKLEIEDSGKVAFGISIKDKKYHFLFIDRFFILFYEDNFDTNYKQLVNFKEKHPKFALLTEEEWETLIKQFADFYAKVSLILNRK
jgi:hypothetical protein